jgi:hypothetical protein
MTGAAPRPLFGPITQLAFMTRDIHASIAYYTQRMGIGPWFLAERSRLTGHYRGQPCEFLLSVAMAHAGGVQLELMQTDDEVPTIYLDWTRRSFVREVQQHVCVWPDDYDGKIALALAAGYENVQDGETGNGRFIYLAHADSPDHVVEITEQTPKRRAFNTGVANAANGWNGRDPVRPMAAAYDFA